MDNLLYFVFHHAVNVGISIDILSPSTIIWTAASIVEILVVCNIKSLWITTMISLSLPEFSLFQVLHHSLLLWIHPPCILLIHFKTRMNLTTMLIFLKIICFLFHLPMQPLYCPLKATIHILGHQLNWVMLHMLLIYHIQPTITFRIATWLSLASQHLIPSDRILGLFTGRYILMWTTMVLNCMQKGFNLVVTIVCLSQ